MTGERVYENVGSFNGIISHYLYNCEDIFAILALKTALLSRVKPAAEEL